ncbi:MAG: hypothetical protein IJ083_00160 [Clostridia bacterium]|nr:hypothetical protein [Clostridia bacterium]
MKRSHRKTDLPLALLFSLVSLLVLSKSSPLYPMNDWVDVHCFLTVGRGITQGLMPYRDLVDQKGPVLYLLFSAGSLLSKSSFLGVFFLEWLLFACFLYISHRIALLYTDSFYVPRLVMLFFSVSIPLSAPFAHGCSAEELSLPFLLLPLFLALRSRYRGYVLTPKEAFCTGFCAGLVFWIKYSLMGLFAGLAIATIFICEAPKRWSVLLRMALHALLGFLAVTLPVLVWFFCRGALPDLFHVYFEVNLSSYAASHAPRHDPLHTVLLQAFAWSCPAMLSFILPLFQAPSRRVRECVLVFLSAALLTYTLYLPQKSYVYYALPLSIFAPSGLSALLEKIRTYVSS